MKLKKIFLTIFSRTSYNYELILKVKLQDRESHKTIFLCARLHIKFIMICRKCYVSKMCITLITEALELSDHLSS